MGFIKNTCAILLILGWWASTLELQAEPLKEARTAVQEWIEVEKTRSREAAEWQEEQQLLKDRIQILQQEKKSIDSELAKARSRINEADKTRQNLLDKEEKVESTLDTLKTFIGELEKELLALRPRLPEPLQEDLSESYAKIPKEKDSSKSVGERFQVAMGILKTCQQFNHSMRVTTRTIENEQGRNIQVRTLYAGLSQAWYVGPDTAGYGFPGPNGWTWTETPSEKSAIKQAIEMAERGVSRAEFVDLPIQIKQAE